MEEKTNGLLDNGRFARSGRTSLIDGEVFASLRACIESGLPPWLVAPDLVTDAYCRMDRPAALFQAVSLFRTRQAGIAEISCTEGPAAIRWSIRLNDRRKSARLLSARNRRGPFAGLVLNVRLGRTGCGVRAGCMARIAST